jgi:hypothetical protein
MPRSAVVCAALLGALVVAAAPAAAADASKVKAATKQVDEGAHKIGAGKIGPGIEQTAKGIGHTIVEGSKFTGEKLKESGKAAETPAKGAWANLKESATGFGRSVKTFFSKLAGN